MRRTEKSLTAIDVVDIKRFHSGDDVVSQTISQTCYGPRELKEFGRIHLVILFETKIVEIQRKYIKRFLFEAESSCW